MERILDFVASLALVFNVDWAADYDDDMYVKAVNDTVEEERKLIRIPSRRTAFRAG